MKNQKTIYYFETGMGEKDYALLEYDKTIKKYIVRRGYSLKKSSSQDLVEHEDVYEMAHFLHNFPRYSKALDILIAEIQRENREKRELKDLNNSKSQEIAAGTEPESHPERRKSPRIGYDKLLHFSNNKQIHVNLHSDETTTTGYLEDISEHGFAVMHYKELAINHELRTTFRLGAATIHSKAVVRNINTLGRLFRIGFEFKELPGVDASIIFNVIASKTADAGRKRLDLSSLVPLQ